VCTKGVKTKTRLEGITLKRGFAGAISEKSGKWEGRRGDRERGAVGKIGLLEAWNGEKGCTRNKVLRGILQISQKEKREVNKYCKKIRHRFYGESSSTRPLGKIPKVQ